jgi:hypothetical protein
MKFRPKKSRREQLNELLQIHIEESSDDELDEIEPNAPFTAPNPLARRKITYSRDVLRLHLHHGDILIQQGAGLQKYYEVYPADFWN